MPKPSLCKDGTHKIAIFLCYEAEGGSRQADGRIVYELRFAHELFCGHELTHDPDASEILRFCERSLIAVANGDIVCYNIIEILYGESCPHWKRIR